MSHLNLKMGARGRGGGEGEACACGVTVLYRQNVVLFYLILSCFCTVPNSIAYENLTFSISMMGPRQHCSDLVANLGRSLVEESVGVLFGCEA